MIKIKHFQNNPGLTLLNFWSLSCPGGILRMFLGIYQKHTFMNSGCKKDIHIILMSYEMNQVIQTFKIQVNKEINLVTQVFNKI